MFGWVVYQSECSGDPQNGANAYDADFCSNGEYRDLLIVGSVEQSAPKSAPRGSGGWGHRSGSFQGDVRSMFEVGRDFLGIRWRSKSLELNC